MKKLSTLIILVIISFFSFRIEPKALTNISINNHNLVPSFDINTKEYNVFVNSNTEIIGINVAKEENEEVTGYGSQSLKKGLNIIEIISYKNNIRTIYTLNIVRGEYKTDKKEALLSNLEIKGHEIDFDSNTFKYNIDANENEKEIEISYKTNNPLTKVKVSKNLELDKEENIIKLEVTSEDKKTTNTYVVKVNKKISKQEKEKKESFFDSRNFSTFQLKLIRIGLISFGVIIIGTFFYFIFIKKRTNKVPNILQRILRK